MPQVGPAAVLQLVLLLCALPAQYLISKWTSSTEAQRLLATKGLVNTWTEARRYYLNVTAWTEWMHSWLPKLAFLEDEEEAAVDSLSLDLLLHNNDLGFFGASTEVHSPRPAYVLHRVGQVVMDTRSHMVGVIVGWDAELRAPPEWIKRKRYIESELEDTPHYKILFSGPDASSLLVGYLPQSNLQLIQGFKPDIPTLSQYFTHFDGTRFVMEDWLREIYPED